MEDAATAEISRGQVWQWIRHGVELDDGRTVTPELVREMEAEELETIRSEIGDDEWFQREGRPDLSRELFERVALGENFEEFLTLPALEKLPDWLRLGGFALALGLAQRLHRLAALVARGAVQDQLAVEVVHLVLDHARLQARGLDQPLLALLVAGADPDVHGAVDVHPHSGDREAALLERLLLLAAPLELGVDQGDHRSVGADAVDQHALGDPQLRAPPGPRPGRRP